MTNKQLNLENYSFKQKGQEYYINLGKTHDNLDKILIAPVSWFSSNVLIFPDNRVRLLLRYEFFQNGKSHLKKEEEITASNLSKIL